MKHDSPTDSAIPAGGLTRGIVPGGTVLADFLYPEPAERRVGAIIGWWEKRRLPYNLIVGGTGLVTMTFGAALTAVVATLQPVDMFRAAIWWAVWANVCYSLGPVAEITLEKLFGRRLLPTGPLLFRAGVTVAVGVTLLPIIPLTIGFILNFFGIL
ncbi:hypothetical protein [Candidatus Palauibacter soopunensis]|uniref:hypothetical protein n=1 Tax=Candidatus Palauibacter soopunensis TaxID=3056739 RepID=UPI00239CB862|nr:hypothetical protein [Candidatus Palauibacter soopunensis]MDE2878929.1 hypothetical protein [Candidatus Palauibacter soopunensis]